MNLSELKTLLDSTGYPVAYDHFNDTPSVPFIAYLETGTVNFFADNKVYEKVIKVDVELYTDKKDLTAETALESVLDANEIPWEVLETWIESEKLLLRTYEIGVD